MRMGETDGATWKSAEATISTMTITDCDDNSEIFTVEDNFSLLGDEFIDIPAGEICEISLLLEDSLTLQGELEGDPTTTFAMNVDLPDNMLFIYAINGFEIDDTNTVLEIGAPNQLQMDDLELTNGEETLIETTADVATEYGGILATTSALWFDVDEDGEVSDAERSTPLASGEDWEPEQNEGDDETGCGDGDGDEGWLLLMLFPFVFRRSRLNRIKAPHHE
jgi:hypothetical protein